MDRPAPPPPGLVIFDCDGVLVDSETISLDVMLELLAEHGCVLSSRTAYDHLLGRSLTANVAWLKRTQGLDLSDDDLATLRTRLYRRFDAELAPIPGVASLLDRFAEAGIPTCVASSSQPGRIRRSLAATGLLDKLEPHVFSASMVTNGKPAPDLFLLAAERMGTDPARCLVIEDSPAGIRAARAAGMRVVAFTGGSHAGPAQLDRMVAECAPDTIISDMADLCGESAA